MNSPGASHVPEGAGVRLSYARLIRDEKLYRESYATFDAYCRGRWGWSRAYVYRQMQAADTAEIVSPVGDKPITSERQARELSPLAREDR